MAELNQAELDALLEDSAVEPAEKAEAEKPTTAASEEKAHVPLRSAQRDVPISTLVRMMGLPTKVELTILEQKIDALTSRISTIASKLDRVVSSLEHGSEFDRLDVQLSDIRTTLKEILPKAVASLSNSGVRAAVASSEVKSESKKNSES